MVNEGERVLYPSIEKNLRTEYEQTWQDFRHRTIVQMTILSVYFATVAGLIYTFAQHGTEESNIYVGPIVGLVAIFLSIGVLVLLLGERRAWSADMTRLKEVEALLSHENEHRVRLERIRSYNRLWITKGYTMRLAGSFAWFLIVVVLTGAVLGGIAGYGLAEIFCPSCLVIPVLSSVATALLLCAIVFCIMWITTRDSVMELLRELGDREH